MLPRPKKIRSCGIEHTVIGEHHSLAGLEYVLDNGTAVLAHLVTITER